MISFMSGAVCAGLSVASLFFLRFWTRTRDPLFLTFSSAFLLFAAGQIATTIVDGNLEESAWVYVLRVVGFVLIIAAVLRKSGICRRQKGRLDIDR